MTVIVRGFNHRVARDAGSYKLIASIAVIQAADESVRRIGMSPTSTIACATMPGRHCSGVPFERVKISE